MTREMKRKRSTELKERTKMSPEEEERCLSWTSEEGQKQMNEDKTVRLNE